MVPIRKNGTIRRKRHENQLDEASYESNLQDSSPGL